MKLRTVVLFMLTAIFLANVPGVSQAGPASAAVRQQEQPRFTGGVEAVTVTATVRDRRGRVVRHLRKTDFEVRDAGVGREIRDFYAGEAPVSLAVLLDISGSMAVGGNMDRARHAVAVAMSTLRAGEDEAALFTFDSRLHQAVAFTGDLSRIARVGLDGRPWGMTSLHDAIAAAATAVGERANRHRALLVITDGVDTGSRISAPEVSGIASAIDVQVYLLTVVTPVDHPGGDFAVIDIDQASVDAATLADLARWTGGDMRIASVPAHTVAAIQDLFAGLRYQYFITFETGAQPGWHPLEIRTRQRNLIVHARSGYVAGPLRSED